METRPCPVCDNLFQAGKTVRTVYCSMVCRREAERRRDQALDEEQIDGSARRRHPHRRLGSGSPHHHRSVRPRSSPTWCQQPVTIIALPATPEAGRPTMPQHRNDVVPLRRTP
ncbi:hypothetical protein [Streptomyces spiralis]|nr:hypothetical protein [Streptomyces spiralis]